MKTKKNKVSELWFNVTLTPDQQDRINEQIVLKSNSRKACDYAGLGIDKFNDVLKGVRGAKIKNTQRDKLLQFCDLVEGKTAA